MRADIWDFMLVASICAVPFMMFSMILGRHGLEVSRQYLNRRLWSDEPLLPSPNQLDVAVFWEGVSPFLAVATTFSSLLILHAAPIPRGAWQVWPALAVGMASATSACAVLLSSSFDMSYQRGLLLQIVFLLVVTWYSVLIVVAGLLLFGTVVGTMLLIIAML